MSNALDTPSTSPLAEDDSPYLSMADFFALISLTLIYVAMSLASPGQKSNSEIAVLSGAFSGSGPGSAVDPRTAYISVVSEDAQVVVRLIRMGPSVNTEIRIPADRPNAQTTLSWLEEHMAKGQKPTKAILYLELKAASPSAHKVMNELTSALKKKIDVAVVFGDDK
jgi:hypothetical protein